MILQVANNKQTQRCTEKCFKFIACGCFKGTSPCWYERELELEVTGKWDQRSYWCGVVHKIFPKCCVGAFVSVEGLSEVFCYPTFAMLFLNLVSMVYKLSLPRKNVKGWSQYNILETMSNFTSTSFLMNSHVLLPENQSGIYVYRCPCLPACSFCSCSFNKYFPSTHSALAVLLGPIGVVQMK